VVWILSRYLCNPQETVTVASKLVLLIDLRPRNGIISMINKKSKFIELRFYKIHTLFCQLYILFCYCLSGGRTKFLSQTRVFVKILSYWHKARSLVNQNPFIPSPHAEAQPILATIGFFHCHRFNP
jgi:hypothetical protein